MLFCKVHNVATKTPDYRLTPSAAIIIFGECREDPVLST
jgi:hypothetical protein